MTAIIALLAVASSSRTSRVSSRSRAPLGLRRDHHASADAQPATSTTSTSSVTLVGRKTATSTAATQSPSFQLTSPGTGSPSAGTTAGLFGESLAVGGTFLVVGAPNETSSSLAAAGNVYVYNSSSGTLLRA